MEAAFAKSQAEVLLLSFDSDWLYPTSESQMIAAALRQVGRAATHIELQSIAGHDAFLIDYAEQVPFVQDFLDSL
ncbi:MAG: hypothetical protein SH847_05875 [Roseiflexaceae bacterium]|nr:hypothetical protein [Roseiflexaceae bacterium]